MTANQGVTSHAALMRYEPAPADIPANRLAATYTREVRAGIERIWENVLDWEHLPALHDIYFNHVALIEIGSWGWRVELTKAGTADRRMLLELQIDRAKARYRVRTLAGEGTGTEIWTLLEALGPQRTAIEVRFYLPEHRPERLAALGEKYRSSYAPPLGPGRSDDDAPGGFVGAIANAQRGSGASLALGPLSELRGCRSSWSSMASRSASSSSRMACSSLTRRSARTGSGRSTRPPRRTACCAAHGTAIGSICAPA